jgi:RND family efflux transporter MFP subunit
MGLRGLSVAVVMLAAVGVLEGCKPRQAAFVPPPPPDVQVAHPIVKRLPQTLDFTGFTTGIQQVDVQAQVRGYIVDRSVTGGERVKAGDVLFKIDPRPFQAAVDQAKADVAQNDAKVRLAQIKLERVQQSGSAVSKTELDQAIADRDAAQAALDLARAKLQTAEIDLDWTSIRAPIGGRISVTVPSVGSMVGENNNQVLVQIIDDTTIYVTFNVPESTVLTMRKQYNYSRPGEGGRPPLPVYIGFANDGDRYPFAGHYDSSDPGFDPNTGTTVVKAIFPNQNGEISPGAFARIRSVTGEEQATLVPDAAVSSDQVGRYVLTVNDKGIVDRTPVEVGGVVDRMRKITSSLPAEVQVVVNGLQRARPGMPVKPTLITLPDPHIELGVTATQPTTAKTTSPTTAPTTQEAGAF